MAQAAEIRWWRAYLRKKDPGEYLSSKSAYWKRYLDTVGLVVPPAARVLDAGCGPAGIFMVLPDANVDALDPLLGEYERDLPHFERSAYPWVTFEAQSLEMLDRAAEYDVIFCLNVINHVADLEESLRRLFRAGKAGSRFVFSIDCHNHLPLRRLFSWIPGDILHPHQFTLREYTDLASGIGWEVISTHLIRPGRIFDYHAVVCRVPGSAYPSTG